MIRLDAVKGMIKCKFGKPDIKSLLEQTTFYTLQERLGLFRPGYDNHKADIKVDEGKLDMWKLGYFLKDRPTYYANKFYAVTNSKVLQMFSEYRSSLCDKTVDASDPVTVWEVKLDFIINNSITEPIKDQDGNKSGFGSVIFFIDGRFFHVIEGKLYGGSNISVYDYLISEPQMCLVYGWREK